jgi:RNA polymerase sigma-70 factor, ECF subfamily
MDSIQGDIDSLLRTRPAGDSEVIEAIVLGYRAPVYRLALSILNDADEAEDAVQDTFLRAAAAIYRYQVGTNFKAWIYTIAINTCRDYLRKRAARAARDKVLQAIYTLTEHTHGPEAAAIQNESRTRLWDLVNQLGEKHRLVVILRLAHNLTILEISQILEINEKTVYSRLYDAFRKLRQKLTNLPEYENFWLEERS